MQEKRTDSSPEFFLAQLITTFAVYRISDNTVFLTRQYCQSDFSHNLLLIKLYDKQVYKFNHFCSACKMNLVVLRITHLRNLWYIHLCVFKGDKPFISCISKNVSHKI